MNIPSCKCGETNLLEFYKYRTYQCKKCFKNKISQGSIKAAICKCGEIDPLQFYKRTKNKCKKCVGIHASASYKNAMTNNEKVMAKRKYNLAYQKDNIFHYRFTAASRRAKDRNIEFDITEEYLKTLYKNQNGCCYYTGIPFNIDTKHYTWSIDRVDSSKGYVMDNVVLAANIINSMKNELSVNEFIDIAKILVEYQKL